MFWWVTIYKIIDLLHWNLEPSKVEESSQSNLHLSTPHSITGNYNCTVPWESHRWIHPQRTYTPPCPASSNNTHLSLSSSGLPFSGKVALMASKITCGMSIFLLSAVLCKELCESSPLSPKWQRDVTCTHNTEISKCWNDSYALQYRIKQFTRSAIFAWQDI